MAETFLSQPEWKVRGITRNPSGAAAQALTGKGVEIVQGDLDDKDSLVPAFEGANLIFSNTDFFGHLWQGLSLAPEVLAGRSPNQYAYDREVEQGLNIAEAASKPSVLKTLERFVLSSLSDAKKWSGGKYANVYHNDTKTAIIDATKARFPEVAARTSYLQVGHYVRNWQTAPPLRPQKQDDGSFVVQRTFSPTFAMPFIVTHLDTGVFVHALADLPAGTNLLGVSEHMTWPAWTELWGKVLGVKASFKQVSYEEFFTGVPEPVKAELADTFKYVEEFGYTGGDPSVVTVEQVRCKSPLAFSRARPRRKDNKKTPVSVPHSDTCLCSH